MSLFPGFLLAAGVLSTAATDLGEVFSLSDDEAFALLVGRWHGCYSFDDDGAIGFLSARSADGRYVLESKYADRAKGEFDSLEVGTWGVREGVFFSIYERDITEVSGENIPFVFPLGDRLEYRILKLDEDEFVYRSDELEITFNARRVPAEFTLSPDVLALCVANGLPH